jgi:hypothetical protein
VNSLTEIRTTPSPKGLTIITLKERQVNMPLKILKLIVVVLLLNSCCNESNENSGIIQANLEIEGFYNTSYHCLNLPDTACIRNDSLFVEIFKITGTDADCGEITLPEVDFSNFSILINHKKNSEKLFYHRTVTVDSTNRIVTYLVSTVSCPSYADTETESYNLVLVPKIGNDFIVEYK